MRIDLDELERLARAATPGPWMRQDFHSGGNHRNGIDDSDGGVVCASYGHKRDKDFDFIAAANPVVVIELVRRMREAEVKAAAPRLKDHLFRELVNDLRDIATEWHSSQQLRERISGRLRKSIEPSAAPCQGHARQQDGEESRCTWSLPTSHDEDNGIWHSSCGELWSFIDGGPAENRVRYCHGCGQPVDVQPYASTQQAKSGD